MRGSFFSLTIPLDVIVIGLGLWILLWRPSSAWVETHFTNGYYPGWQGFWGAVTRPLPFALGDAIIGLAIIALLVALGLARPLWRSVLGVVALCAFFVIWFYAGWGFGYDRAPLETRTSFDASRISPSAIDALRARVTARMNRLAPVAHRAAAERAMDEAELVGAWLPVVARLGDAWVPQVAPAKPAAAGLFMDLSGTSGFTNPFTLETQLAPDLIWFERPFSQAHEWSHVAGFNREDEANYIAAVTCLRDPDPIAQYSGALEIFLYLPALRTYPHTMFGPLVWQDFDAIRKRNSHFVNLNFSRFSWHVYNSYLKSNHIASGVQNYDEVTRLLAGIPLDAAGLPVKRP